MAGAFLDHKRYRNPALVLQVSFPFTRIFCPVLWIVKDWNWNAGGNQWNQVTAVWESGGGIYAGLLEQHEEEAATGTLHQKKQPNQSIHGQQSNWQYKKGACEVYNNDIQFWWYWFVTFVSSTTLFERFNFWFGIGKSRNIKVLKKHKTCIVQWI